MKIYIAGKITNYPNFKAKFAEAKEKLTAGGHAVLDPSVLPGGFEQDEYMHICYSMIDVCEGIFMLNNWRYSKGATMEHEYARKNQKLIIYQECMR